MSSDAPVCSPPPTLLVLASMISTQVGSAIAKPLFPEVGSSGVVFLRLCFATLLLLLWQRPELKHLTRRDYGLLLVFGLSIALMNGCFYGAIARIPLGIAVTLEFLGPLGVALLNSRRPLDWVWVLFAAAGVVLLSPGGQTSLDPWGLGLALLAAVGWGSYILLAARVGKVLTGPILPLVLAIAALAMLPLGIASGGIDLLQPKILALGVAIAFLSSVVTYSFEMEALKRMPVNVFGVWMSLEPAIAAGLGFLVLGEALSGRSLMAIALVSLAAAGSAAQSRSAASLDSLDPH